MVGAERARPTSELIKEDDTTSAIEEQHVAIEACQFNADLVFRAVDKLRILCFVILVIREYHVFVNVLYAEPRVWLQ